MRHKKNFNHLGRKRGHRKAMLSNMASSLIMHRRIKTTVAKAKALKTVVEPLITKAKNDTTHARREAFRILQDKEATNELFREVSEKVGDRPGGYTRIIKLGARLGDNAEMCYIELVDYNENMLAEKSAATKSSRRRRGSKKKSDVDATATSEVAEEIVDTEAPAEEVAEAPVEEAAAKAVVEEAVAEAPAEEPVAEVEMPAEDKAEEVVAEEAPAEEVKEEPKAEAKEDASSEALAKDEEKPAEEDEKKAE